MHLKEISYNKNFEKVKKRIIKKLGKGNPKKWLNKDFEELSWDIQQHTNVLISSSTLKRIFGKSKTPERYYPQQATFEALTKYSAYLYSIGRLKNINKTRKIIIISIIFVISVMGGIAFLFYRVYSNKNHKKCHLQLIKIEGFAPTSAHFKYKIPKIDNHYYIDFDDGRKNYKLNPEENKKTHFYRYPGVFKAKIKADKEIVSNEVDFVVQTQGWQALTYYYKIPHEERYFYPVPLEKVSDNNIFNPTARFLHSIGIDTTKAIMMQLMNFSITNKNGDSFRFKTRLKIAEYWPGIQCYSTYIEVAGTKNNILFMLTSKGCSHWNILNLSEKEYSGENFDLSKFILNPNEWQEIGIINKNKEVEISIGEDTIYKEKYEEAIGNIAGVSIIFLSNGSIEYIKLHDPENNLIFNFP